MLLPLLIFVLVILGIIVFYFYYLKPRFNPLNRADNFIKQNMITEAVIEYKRILEKDPAKFVVHYKLADLYFKQDKIDQGVLHLEEIVKLNKYNYEVDKIDVYRMLAKAYLSRGDIDKPFSLYSEILMVYPGDIEALYHVAFAFLGQEYFDYARSHFEKLANYSKKSFEVQFGAGMANFQDRKTSEAIDYYKEALSIEPLSDIANLAITFALLRKRDFKSAINYIKMVVENATEQTAVFIARRLLGILNIYAKKPEEALKVFQELLDYARKNEMDDEVVIILYDLGFVSVRAEKAEQAYEYWDQLFQIERDYKDISKLITILRKEMDVDGKQKNASSIESVENYIEKWLEDAFPEDFIWNICGLKSDREIDLKDGLKTVRTTSGKDERTAIDSTEVTSEPSEVIDKFCRIDSENFRIISSRVVVKLGYSVDEILPTYKEADGVDFMARSTIDRQNVLVWVRRWRETKVGEIPLRNFAQAINDIKAKKGVLITTSDLTGPAENALKRLSKVSVIYPDQLIELLVDQM